MNAEAPQREEIQLRTTIRPGDIGWITYRHGVLYAREHGFDETFSAYVAGPLSEFLLRGSPRDRLWIAEVNGQFAGCIGIVDAGENDCRTAQLRWYLVEPEMRGRGIGKRLVREAVAFSREQAYARIILWTVSVLESASRVYCRAGFRPIVERSIQRWGLDLVEQQYELALS